MSRTQYYTEHLFIGDVHQGRDTNRYYLSEYFTQLPALNADLAPSSADDGNDGATAAQLATMNAANKNFEIKGTNATSDDITFSTTEGGAQLQTDGADNDQVIVLPHLVSSQSAWFGINWGTENQTHWACAIRTGASIADMSFWAGLKLTNTPVYATDADQAYFLYSSNGDMGALTTNGKLHFVYSVGGTDYITNLGITVDASTIYRFRIEFDSNRKIKIYVNETQYGLVTSATAGGAEQSYSKQLSLAMTDDIDLIPYVGVQALTGSAKQITLCYEHISRVLYE